MAELHVRFEDENLQLAEDEGVLTNIYSSHGKSVRRTSIPVASSKYKKFELDAGTYLVECILPSGRIVTKDVVLEKDEVKRISIETERSSHEWLAWQQYTGNVAERKAYERARVDTVTKQVDPWSEKLRGPGANTFGLRKTRLEGTNSIYQKVLTLPETPADRAAADDRQEMVDELMLTELFEASGDPIFNGQMLWDTIVNLNGPDSGNQMVSLMADSRSSLRPPTTERRFEPIAPMDLDEISRRFLILPKTEPPIRSLFFWSPSGAELLRLPGEWINSKENTTSSIDVLVDVSTSTPEFRSSVTVHDPTLISALAYWSAGSVPTAGQHFQRAATAMLFEKQLNPFAAAMGGYILLSLGDPDSKDNWPQWIGNLFNWFEWLPDGAVLKGWLELKQKKPEQALTSFRVAVERGVPVFSMGIKQLLNGLRLFSSEDGRAKELQQRVQKVAWRTNMSQPFTTIRLGPTQ
jgi:hypothetical protein